LLNHPVTKGTARKKRRRPRQHVFFHIAMKTIKRMKRVGPFDRLCDHEVVDYRNETFLGTSNEWLA
jgi:hypothetical protein